MIFSEKYQIAKELVSAKDRQHVQEIVTFLRNVDLRNFLNVLL